MLEAYSLGLGEPIAISAEHGEGLADLHAAIAPFADRAAATDAAPKLAAPRKIQLATNALARIVIKNTSHPVDLKIATLKAELEGQTQALGSIDKIVAQLRTAASSPGLSTTERLIVASQLNAQTLQRSQVVDSQALTRQLLSTAQGVEHGQIINTAVPTKTTARSRRNTVIVAALIGLLLGIFAALLWEPINRVVRRTA